MPRKYVAMEIYYKPGHYKKEIINDKLIVSIDDRKFICDLKTFEKVCKCFNVPCNVDGIRGNGNDNKC